MTKKIEILELYFNPMIKERLHMDKQKSDFMINTR